MTELKNMTKTDLIKFITERYMRKTTPMTKTEIEDRKALDKKYEKERKALEEQA